MSQTVIRAESLCKRYRIGGRKAAYRTLRESLIEGVHTSASRFSSIIRRNASENPGNEETIWALKDVTFEVDEGETLGIIGKNGAGKSTLLKILSRITKPTSGQVILRGRVGSLLEVGTGFHPELTGRENIYLNGAILGMRRNEILRKFDEIVDFSEIEKFLDTPVKHYSSGMYMRLAFAVAAHLEPEILLVDEVLAVGDAAFQKKCLGKMGEVANKGRTVLFVSHNMSAIRTLCQLSILLEQGRIIKNGNSSEVVEFYLRSINQRAITKRWVDPTQAPGNNLVRLKSARILTNNDTEFIDVHTPIDIEFEFWNFLKEAILNLSLVLYTHEEVCVLNTVSDKKPYKIGIVRGICHIPGDFLNDAIYRVRILVVQDSQVIFEDTNILTFEVVEAERSGLWHGKWVGVIRPRLSWNTECFPTIFGS